MFIAPTPAVLASCRTIPLLSHARPSTAFPTTSSNNTSRHYSNLKYCVREIRPYTRNSGTGAVIQVYTCPTNNCSPWRCIVLKRRNRSSPNTLYRRSRRRRRRRCCVRIEKTMFTSRRQSMRPRQQFPCRLEYGEPYRVPAAGVVGTVTSSWKCDHGLMFSSSRYTCRRLLFQTVD